MNIRELHYMTNEGYVPCYRLKEGDKITDDLQGEVRKGVAKVFTNLGDKISNELLPLIKIEYPDWGSKTFSKPLTHKQFSVKLIK